jgi:hypothetical protein
MLPPAVRLQQRGISRNDGATSQDFGDGFCDNTVSQPRILQDFRSANFRPQVWFLQGKRRFVICYSSELVEVCQAQMIFDESRYSLDGAIRALGVLEKEECQVCRRTGMI